MVFQVYLIEEDDSKKNKTVTSSESVARFAYQELCNNKKWLGRKLKAVFYKDDDVLEQFDFDCVRVCMKCGFQGIFIRGDTCPTCQLVQ